jgi:hypothetical protein
VWCTVRGAAFVPLFLLYTLVGAGCATDGPGSAGSRQAAPATRYNLAGYSAGFKEGYSDACASPRRRSEQRYKSDNDYRMGWDDGTAMCRR